MSRSYFACSNVILNCVEGCFKICSILNTGRLCPNSVLTLGKRRPSKVKGVLSKVDIIKISSIPPSYGGNNLVYIFTLPAAEIMTVPGASKSPSGYFCFMERESFPVGILIPNAIAKSEHSCTAS